MWWPCALSTQAEWETALQNIANGKRGVNARDRHGRTLLHFAAADFGGLCTFARLLELGAHPSAHSRVFGLPMHSCAISKQKDALGKCKLLPVADMWNKTHNAAITPFVACVLCGNYDVLEYMLQQPECPVEAFLRDQLPRWNTYIELPKKTLLLETAARRQR